MTKKLILLAVIFMIAVFSSQASRAAYVLTTNGDIIVVVEDELGNTISGATVTLRLPGPDGVLDAGLDVDVIQNDGLIGGDSGDDDGEVADGDVEFDNTGEFSGNPYFDGNVADSDTYRITVTKPGYVDYESNETYDTGSVSYVSSANQFTVKVTLRRQLPIGTDLPGGTINVYDTGGAVLQTTVIDDGTDPDLLSDGVVYIAQDPAGLDGGPHTVEGVRSGFITDSDSASTINSDSQSAYIFDLEYMFVITADDELGGTVTLTSRAEVGAGGTLSEVEAQYSGNTLYWAASGGPGDISVTQPGYITATTTAAIYTYSAAGPQVPITLDGGADGPALDFGFVVSATRESDAGALTLTAPDTSVSAGGALTVVTDDYNGGDAYIAAYGSDLMELVHDGYLATSTTLTFASAAQQVIALTDVMFTLKVVVYDESGASVNGCTVTHGATTQDISNLNEYYVPAPADGALSVAKAGNYVTTDSTEPNAPLVPNSTLAAIAIATDTQTVVTFGQNGGLGETSCTAAHTAGDAVTCTGLLFPLKLLLYDELGYPDNMGATATVNLTVTGPADASTENRHFWLGNIAADSLSVAQQGYENMTGADDAALNSVSATTGNRTVITMTGQGTYGAAINAGDIVTAMGVKYGFIITAEDEFGTKVMLNATDTTVTPDPLFTVYAINYSGGDAYLAASNIIKDEISLSHIGFSTVKTTTDPVNWTWDNLNQQTINFDGTDGPPLGYKLRVAVYDELDNPIDETLLSAGSFVIDGKKPAYIPAATNVMYFAVSNPDTLTGYLRGFVDVPLAGDIALLDVNPGTTGRTEIILKGAGSCGGADVPANTQVICGGMQYNIKVTSATTELNAPVTLDDVGDEDFKIFTDSDCTNEIAALSYATTTKFSGGAWYAAPASGATYYPGLIEPGYVTGCDSTPRTPDTGTIQIVADFEGAAGDGLEYNIKLDTVYTETGAMLDGISGGFGEQLVLYGLTGCAGGPVGTASGPFHFGGAWYAAAASNTLYSAEFTEYGYVDGKCSSVDITPDGQTQMNPDFSGANAMAYNLKIAYAETELGAALTMNSDEAIEVYDNPGCVGASVTASNAVYFNSAWYIAAASDTIDYYVSLEDEGYVNTCDADLVRPMGVAQLSPSFLNADGDGLEYNIKLTSAATELGVPLTIDNTNSEEMKVYSVAGCGGAEITTFASGPFYSGGAWYAAATAGTYYASFYEEGYVEACDATSVDPDGTAQTTPGFTGAADGLDYNIVLSSADSEISLPIALDFTNGEDLKIYNSGDCGGAEITTFASGPFYSGGKWYVAATSATTYAAELFEPGYIATCDAEEVTPDGSAQVSLGFSGAPDGVKYAIKVSDVYSEIGALVAMDGSADETVALYTIPGCAGATNTATGPFYDSGSWYSVATAGVTYYTGISISGYLAGACDDSPITPDGANQLLPEFTGAADGLVYNIKLDSAVDELANPVTISENGTVEIYTDAGCVTEVTVADPEVASGPVFFSNAWYVAATSGTTFYMQLEEAGFVQDCDADPTTTDALTQKSPSFTGGDALFYNIKLTAAEDELGYDLDIDGSTGEYLAVYPNSSCGTEVAYASDPFYSGGAWYAAVDSGFYYAAFTDTGYIEECDATQVNPLGTAQVSPTFADADDDGLPYSVVVSAIEDELTNALAVEASDTVMLYSAAGCLGAAATLATGPVFDIPSASWYIGAEPGDYYASYRKSGYVDACDADAITTSTSTPETPDFSGTGLKFSLVVKLADQYHTPISGATITHGGDAPTYSDMGADANIHYFNSTAAAGLAISKSGYRSIDAADNSVEPGGAAVGQTYLTLSGAGSGDIATVSAAIPGTSVTRNGLFHEFNVQITVQYASSSVQNVTDLGNISNFYFEDVPDNRIMPEYYSEVSKTAQPGVYQFKVATSATTLQVKAVDVDGDPYIDAIDSDPIDLTGISSALTDFGTVVLYPAADHIKLSPETDSIVVGATQAITVTVYDNDGAPITVGPHSTMSVRVTLTGGSTDPASEKDIESTTLTGPSPDAASLLSGPLATTVTGALSSGVADVVISDKIITDGSDITIAAVPVSVTLTGHTASASSTIEVEPITFVGSKLIVIDPVDVTTDATASVRIEVQDDFGNIVDTAREFDVVLSGSASDTAVITDATTGSITNPGGASATVETVNGIVVIAVKDTKVEDVTISVIDQLPDMLMDDSSTQDLSFSAGVAKKIIVSSTVPSIQDAGEDITVTCQLQDAGGNNTTGDEVFSIVATGSTNINTPYFGTPFTGTAISDTATNTVVVRADSGVVSIPLSDTTAQTVTISFIDSDSRNFDVTPAQVEFEAASRESIEFMGNTTIKAGVWYQYTLQMQDSYGNALPLGSGTARPIVLDVTTTSHDDTHTYSGTSGGSSTDTTYIETAKSDITIYFMDTLATPVTLQADGTSWNLPTAGTLDVTVTPDDPVSDSSNYSGYPDVSFNIDSTGDMSEVTISYSDFSYGEDEDWVIKYTKTTPTDAILANGSQTGTIQVRLADKFGNPISGEKIILEQTGLSSPPGIIPPSGELTTDDDGEVTFYVSSNDTGSGEFTLNLANLEYNYDYATPFTMYFKTRESDLTPPTISITEDCDPEYDTYCLPYTTLADGDYIDPVTGFEFTVYIEDPGDNPSGISESDFTLEVTNNSTGLDYGTSDAECPDTPTNGIYECTVTWTPTSEPVEGTYTAVLTVEDKNGNPATHQWNNLLIEIDSAALVNVLAGGTENGVFDPRHCQCSEAANYDGCLKIAYQVSSSMGTVSLDIYNRSGRLVYSTMDSIDNFGDVGYNEIPWCGQMNMGGWPGNGIYLFRMTVNIPGKGTTTRTGKFAVFKQ